MMHKQEIAAAFNRIEARANLADDVCSMFRNLMLKVAEAIPAGEARTTALQQLKATRDAVINAVLKGDI